MFSPTTDNCTRDKDTIRKILYIIGSLKFDKRLHLSQLYTRYQFLSNCCPDRPHCLLHHAGVPLAAQHVRSSGQLLVAHKRVEMPPIEWPHKPLEISGWRRLRINASVAPALALFKRNVDAEAHIEEGINAGMIEDQVPINDENVLLLIIRCCCCS